MFDIRKRKRLLKKHYKNKIQETIQFELIYNWKITLIDKYRIFHKKLDQINNNSRYVLLQNVKESYYGQQKKT